MEPLISVIIPVYKVEDYLDQCVQSITEQTYKNLEIILVVGDGGDRCPQMCGQWAKKDGRVVVVPRESNGLSDARNAGLDVKKGEYVAFIDSDDYVDKDYIKKLYDALIKTQSTTAVCGLQIVDEHGKITEALSVTEKNSAEVYTGREIVRRELLGNWALVTSWGALFKADIFSELRFPYKRRNEDEFTFPLVYDGQKRVVCVPDNMYFYLQRSDSLMGAGYSKKDCTDYLDMWHERIAFYGKEERRELLPLVIESFLAWDVLYMAMHGGQMEEPEKKALKDEIRRYFLKLWKRPYPQSFGASMKLAVKCVLTLVNHRILGKRYV